MQSVGTKLREAREKKGFSLDEIKVRTRINSRNLIAIECDEVRTISSPFFYRSFVRQYAEIVDLDFQKLAPEVEMMTGNMRQPDLPGRGEYLPVRVTPAQPRPKSDSKWMLPTLIVVFFVASGSGLLAAWNYYRPLVHAATLSAQLPEEHSASGAVHIIKPQSFATRTETLATVSSVPADAASAESAISKASSIHLQLAATEPTWLLITADGKPAYQGILEPSESKVLDGNQIARIKTGNAGGVVIKFNGKEIGPIGPKGKTRTVVFTKAGYQVQRSQRSDLVPASHIGG